MEIENTLSNHGRLVGIGLLLACSVGRRCCRRRRLGDLGRGSRRSRRLALPDADPNSQRGLEHPRTHGQEPLAVDGRVLCREVSLGHDVATPRRVIVRQLVACDRLGRSLRGQRNERLLIEHTHQRLGVVIVRHNREREAREGQRGENITRWSERSRRKTKRKQKRGKPICLTEWSIKVPRQPSIARLWTAAKIALDRHCLPLSQPIHRLATMVRASSIAKPPHPSAARVVSS